MSKRSDAKRLNTKKAKKEKEYEVWDGDNDEIVFKNLTEMNGCILQLLKKWQADLNPETAKIKDVISKNSFTNFVRNIPYSSRETRTLARAFFNAIDVNLIELNDDERQDLKNLLSGLASVLDFAGSFRCLRN